MVELMDNKALSAILKASSDATRRELLTQLVRQGPTRVTDLAAIHAISLNAISKHIKVLESTGLVTRKTIGRTHWIEAELEPLKQIDLWFSQLKSIGEQRLIQLKTVLVEGEKND